jgi:hypothetical protein
VKPLRTESVEVVEKPVKAEQQSSAKETRKCRKRKSQVRFSPSPTREETAHHADVEDNVAVMETPPTGRRRMVRPSKMLDMMNKTSPVKSKSTPDLHPVKRGEDKSNKRKRRESLGNQSSDGTAETVEVLSDRKKSKPEPVAKVGKVGSVRHPPVTKEETIARNTNAKVSKTLNEDGPKTKSNAKQQAVGENTQKAVATNKHNTRHQHHESSLSEPEVKRSKRQEPEEGAIRSSGRRRFSSRDTRSATNSNAGEF